MSLVELEAAPLNGKNGHNGNNPFYAPLSVNSEAPSVAPSSVPQSESNWTLHRQYTQFPQYNSDYSDAVKPKKIIEDAIGIGYKKLTTPVLIMLIRGILSGAYVSFSVTLVFTAQAAGWDTAAAGLLFPAGFIMLLLFGNDLVTGNMGLCTLTYLKYRKKKKNITFLGLLWNWTLVIFFNFLGCIIYAFIFWAAKTNFGKEHKTIKPVKEIILSVGYKKTIVYKKSGAGGWFGSIFSGILCNWMITMGVLMGLTSKAIIGKIFAMYIPVTMFFLQGFEHTVVNLFILPMGLFFDKAKYNFYDWIVWNQIPVTIGNILGGVIFTSLAYYSIFLLPDEIKSRPKKEKSSSKSKSKSKSKTSSSKKSNKSSNGKVKVSQV